MDLIFIFFTDDFKGLFI